MPKVYLTAESKARADREQLISEKRRRLACGIERKLIDLKEQGKPLTKKELGEYIGITSRSALSHRLAGRNAWKDEELILVFEKLQFTSEEKGALL